MRVERLSDKVNSKMRALNLTFKILSLKIKKSMIRQSDAPHA
jgi:hypothetical protein